MVDFCQKCDAIIIGKKGQETECPSCGHISKAENDLSLKKEIKNSEGDKEIINKDNVEEVHPTTNIECPSCKHNEAYYWTKQTRAGDEPETQFFKCCSCKKQWREYR